MAPLKIGLTGGIAAGKSEALAAFGRLGAATVSSDAIVHELLDDEPMLSAIAERWGEGAIVDGAVDRSRVGEIVFADPEELAWLEASVHPLVGERIASWLDSLPADTPAAVIEVPLLFETEMEGLFDATVTIHTSDPVRKARAGERGPRIGRGARSTPSAPHREGAPRRSRGTQRRHDRRAGGEAVRPDRQPERVRAGPRTGPATTVSTRWPRPAPKAGRRAAGPRPAPQLAGGESGYAVWSHLEPSPSLALGPCI